MSAQKPFFLQLAQFLLRKEDVSGCELVTLTEILEQQFPGVLERMSETVQVICAQQLTQAQLTQWVIEHPEEAAKELFDIRYPNSPVNHLGILKLLYATIDDDRLDLGVRTANCLKAENVFYIYQLVQHSERSLLSMPNFGKKALTEIKESLTRNSLALSMKLSDELIQSIERELQFSK